MKLQEEIVDYLKSKDPYIVSCAIQSYKALRRLVSEPPEESFVSQVGYIIIEFDGGTSCNNPKVGYGIGYGSFKIGEGKITRKEFGNCSVNAAEVYTIAKALEAVPESWRKEKFLVRGDSMIAINWVKKAFAGVKRTEKHLRMDDPFCAAIEALYAITGHFKHIDAEWRRRHHSLRIFGH